MSQTREALRRYSRQIILPEIALAGQEIFSASNVLVIGAGGLGAPVLTYLTSSGVGRIVISEDDTLAVSNLQRQFLFDSRQIGGQKRELALQRLRALNPLVTLEGAARLVQGDIGREALRGTRAELSVFLTRHWATRHATARITSDILTSTLI